MTQQEFNDKLARNKARAAEIAAALPGAPDKRVEALIIEFICCKYFLTPEELDTENLLALGDRSTEKLAGLKKGGLVYADKSVGCTSAGSSMIKKVLLAMALGKAVGVKPDPDRVAFVDTVTDLTALILSMRKGE